MRRSEKWAITFGVLAIVTMLVIGPNHHNNTYTTTENNYSQKNSEVEATAKDHLMAEDLAKTTSLFLSALSEQLDKWSEHYSNGDLSDDFAEEIREHPYISGMALLTADQQLEQTIGTLENFKESQFSHTQNGIRYSEPYNRDGKSYLIMGKELENNKIIIGEVDLSFIEAYLSETAAIADSSGTFFVSGSDPNVQFKTTAELPDGAKTETVPGLDWNIYVQSKAEELDQVTYKNQAVAKLASHANSTTWAKRNHYQIVSENNPYIVVEKDNTGTDHLLEELRRNEDVLFAEPNYAFANQVQTTESKVEPNDEFFKPYQWNLEQIQIEEGWNLANGQDTVIAIIDSGVDPNHIDLQEKLTEGYNAVDDNDDFTDQNGHGTHVAGIAAAVTNNIEGIAGVSWQSKIMPVKALNENGEGSSYSVARGIYWAVDHGADVINMSLGDYNHSDLLYDAITYAHEQGVILVSASGNDNTEQAMYPAAYPEVITVAAVDENKNRAFFSNYGDHIDVSAPGEHIPSTYTDNQYVVLSGTSMASPHVAGLAALLKSTNPELTNDAIGDIILGTADQLGDGDYNAYYGYGEINVRNSLQQIID